jgi:hypothetical protein
MYVSNSNQEDSDGDNKGNNCDDDDDNDGRWDYLVCESIEIMNISVK